MSWRALGRAVYPPSSEWRSFLCCGRPIRGCSASAASCCQVPSDIFLVSVARYVSCCGKPGRRSSRASMASGWPWRSEFRSPYAVANSRMLNLMLYPILVATQSVPKVAIAPIILVWFGLGIKSKLAIAFLVGVLSDRGRYRDRIAVHAVGVARARALAARFSLSGVRQGAISRPRCRSLSRDRKSPSRWRSSARSSANSWDRVRGIGNLLLSPTRS